ncbi:MAG: glycosyltransferase family 4 protein [bacterium]|nr:glycosyltransferase family 4 protein [bacterium]MDA1024644.1 glycosyltransferase family 4 protein [bacterium]
MRIVHIAPAYPPYGGMGTSAKQMADATRDLGHEVLLYTPRYKKNQSDCQQDIFLRPLFSVGFASFLPQLLWKLRKFDILHLHYPIYGSDVFVWMASLIWHKPLVLSYHMKTVGGGMKGMLFTLHRVLLEPLLLRRAASLLVSSSDYATSIGLSNNRLVDVPFWIDVASRHVRTSKEELRSTYKLKNRPTILFVGGLDDAHYFKGVDVLLRAMAIVRDSVDAQLVLVGEGNRRPIFEKQAQELGVDDFVRFMGRVPDKELKELYAAADVHVLPSIDGSESFGLVTLEAMAAGIPSVVSDLPGIRTLVENGKTGAIVKAGDVEDLAKKLRVYVADLPQANAHGVAAKARARKLYSPKKARGRLQAIYKAVKI